MEHRIPVAPGVELWAEERGDPATSPLLLVMGANASGLTWPEALVDRLAQRHRVVRYDHRDTGRSTRAYAVAPYAVRDLATDAVRLLDGLGIDRAHVVGMSMGGTLVQLLLLDSPDRLRSATVLATSALGSGLADIAGDGDLPGPAPHVLAYWASMGEDPVNPPPHAAHLAAVIGSARLVAIPGMGHALPAAVVAPLADAIAAHTAAVDAVHRGDDEQRGVGRAQPGPQLADEVR